MAPFINIAQTSSHEASVQKIVNAAALVNTLTQPSPTTPEGFHLRCYKCIESSTTKLLT